MTLDPLAEYLRYRFRCGATLASQCCDLVVDLVAQSFESFVSFGSRRAVILSQLCNVTLNLLAERLRQRIGFRATLVGRRGDPAFKLVSTRIEKCFGLRA